MTPEKLWKLLPFLKEQIGIHADVLELPCKPYPWTHRKRGILGDKQWTGSPINSTNEKTNLLLYLHISIPPQILAFGQTGKKDGEALLKVLAENMPMLTFTSTSHEWLNSKHAHLHIIGQPAVSYYFGKGHAHGWIDMGMTKASANPELHCLKPEH